MGTSLLPVRIPGIFVTGTDTGVGKTLIAGAIADWFRRQGRTVAVFKPVATGCVRRREGLVSEDAEFLAHCADSRHPLDLICPQRYAEPLAPAVAAERAGEPVDWEAIQRSLDLLCKGADVIILEGVGGIMVPIDGTHTVLDIAQWIGLPAIVVARAGLGTINHTLLTLSALRGAGVKVAGVVVNRYPSESGDAAEETNPRAIERWGNTRVLAIVAEEAVVTPTLPRGVVSSISRVDWDRIAHGRRA